MTKETALYFPGSDYSLFGVLHETHDPTDRPAIVFCHPFAEEKLWTHRVFVSMARQLAARGFHVLRFDYMGNGDSDGDFSAASVTSMRADIVNAIAYVRRATNARAVGLLGLRFGATLAAIVAESEPAQIAFLALWAPVLDGGRYMQELLRVNLTTQLAVFKEIRQERPALVEVMRGGGTVNVDGYELGFPAYTEISATVLDAGQKHFKGPCLLVHVDKRHEQPPEELARIARSYESGSAVAVKEEAFWREIPQWYATAPQLVAASLDWLDRL